MVIDLNCDMGESFGRYSLGCDELVIAHVTSANLACGFHASDPQVMDRAVALAVEHGVGIGAHPGYHDLRGFGRRNMDSPPEQVRTDVIYQVGALAALAASRGAVLQHVKPHGALYNTAAHHEPTARAVCRAVKAVDPGLILVTLAGPAGQVIRQVAAEEGLKVASEAFADRAYTPEGRLVPRDRPGAVINEPDQVAERCRRMAAEGLVKAVDGSVIELKAQTICVHGDTPSAVELVERINSSLEQAGVDIKPMGRFL